MPFEEKYRLAVV